MNLRLVSGLSETRILTLSQWENERFAVEIVRAHSLLLRRDARDLPIELGSESSFSTISLGQK
jgi:hypothetical protein